jgi:hypothetical protein
LPLTLLLSLSCTAARLASVRNWSSWQIKELEQLLATEQQSFHDKDTAATQQIEKLKETWEGAEQKLPDLLKKEFERGKIEGESEEKKKQTAILHTNTEHASKHLQSVLDDQNNKLKVSCLLDQLLFPPPSPLSCEHDPTFLLLLLPHHLYTTTF